MKRKWLTGRSYHRSMLSLFVVALSFGSWTTAGLEQQDAIAIEFDGEISRPLLGRRFSTLTTPKPRKLIQDVADVQRTGFPNMEDKGERPYTYDDSRDDLYVSRSKGKGKGRPRKGGNPWDGSTGGRDDDEDGVPLRKLLLDGTCLKVMRNDVGIDFEVPGYEMVSVRPGDADGAKGRGKGKGGSKKSKSSGKRGGKGKGWDSPNSRKNSGKGQLKVPLPTGGKGRRDLRQGMDFLVICQTGDDVSDGCTVSPSSISLSPGPTESVSPSELPSVSVMPSTLPSFTPSELPSISTEPSVFPSDLPTISRQPSNSPTGPPSPVPSISVQPSGDPTDSPSDSPSASPTEEPRCVVRSNLVECDDRIATVPPDPSCDCYNFCGDVYVGCCNFDAECDIDCVGFLVAGCVQPPFPTVSPSVSPTLSPTASQAPSISDEPTPVPTVSLEPSISLAPTTEPRTPAPTTSPAPTEPVCTVSVNEELCAEVTQGIEPIENCDCYNFCNGVYNGCCEFFQGQECEQDCRGVVVSGCRIEPETPTTSPAPTESPAPSELPTVSLNPTASFNPSQSPSISLVPSQSSEPSQTPSDSPTTGPTLSISPSNLPSLSPAPSISSSPSSTPSDVLTDNSSISLQPSVSNAPSVSSEPSDIPEEEIVEAAGRISSSSMIPTLAMAAVLVSAAFYTGRRQGRTDAGRDSLAFNKLEMELMYLEEQAKWAKEEQNWKQVMHLEQIMNRKRKNLETRTEAVSLLERSDEAWSSKKMKNQVKFLELEQDSLKRKCDLREDVIKSLREEGDLKQVKIDMLEEMLREIRSKGVEEALVSRDATPMEMEDAIRNIEARNILDMSAKEESAKLCEPENANKESPFHGLLEDEEAKTKDMPLTIDGKAATWIGPTDEDGVPNGTGTVEFANKDVYVGAVVDGKLDGRGTLFVQGGSIIRGVFKNNEYVGR